jgi:AcrR family transcriptional regulator
MEKAARARGPRGEYAKSERRREEIVDAATKVFSEYGLRDGTLRDIAERVGMTHAGMRHHFPTKAALLAAVLRRRDDISLEIGAAAQPKGVEVLREWVAATRRHVEQPTMIDLEVTLAAEAIMPEHPAHDYFAEAYVRADDLLRRAFRDIEADGALAPGITVSQAAHAALAATIGLQQLWVWERHRDLVTELEFAIGSLITVPFP